MNGGRCAGRCATGAPNLCIQSASLPLVPHVQVTAYRRAPYALLSTLRSADEVGWHEPFTGPLLSNSARIILRRLRSRGNKRRSPNSYVIAVKSESPPGGA